VPAGERREIKAISCNARITPNNVPIRIAFLAALNQNESTLGAHFLVLIQHGTATTSSYNSMNHQLYLFAPSNGKFEVVVFADTATEVAMVCGISGQRIQ
jgi:hypothetical protein